jgi:Ca2+-binding RTX toxin-like protein
VKVSGDAGDDRIRTGAGDDTVAGGPGRDRIRTGAGDDTVDVRDGSRDVVRCGPGNDTVTADSFDRLIGCENKA